MLLVNGASLVLLYAFQRLQKFLPLNPNGLGAVSPDSSWNTAVSFTTNTNWQGYSGESTMSHFTQMVGLAYHNFLSAATGIAIAVVIIRGIAREKARGIGNFWFDCTRALLWVLLPFSFVAALVLRLAGRRPELPRRRDDHDRRRSDAEDPGRTVRLAGGDQGAGNQRRRSLQRELGSPVREPDARNELRPAAAHPLDRGGPDEHARPDDRLRPARVGGLRRNARCSSREASRSRASPSRLETRSTSGWA